MDEIIRVCIILKIENEEEPSNAYVLVKGCTAVLCKVKANFLILVIPKDFI